MSEPTTRPTTSVTLFWWCLALIFGAILCGLAEPLFMLWRFIPLDPNEGWNAYFTNIALGGGDLYPPVTSLVANNYPPLSFYVVGVVGLLAGDNIIAGRLIALISMLVVAANIYYWLRATDSAVRIALFGAVAFLAFAVTYGQAYVAIDDPQWLAHAIMTTGLVVLWRGEARARAIIIASILIVAAILTKHLLIPIPIAVTIWLISRSKSAFSVWIISTGVLVSGCFLLLWGAYGEAFFDSLSAPREYSLHQAFSASATALKCLAPLLGLSLLLCAEKRNERALFVAIYVVAAAAIGGAASGGAGVDLNAFFDLIIAASLGAALGIEMLWSGGPQRRFLPADSKLAIGLGPIAVVLLSICTAVYAATKVSRSLATMRNVDALEKTSLNYIEQIRSDGRERGACEMLGLCYWAKSSFTVDFFSYGQKLETGAIPLASCTAVFRGASIPVIQLQSIQRRGSEQLPGECNQVIYENYRPVIESVLGVLLIPRGM